MRLQKILALTLICGLAAPAITGIVHADETTDMKTSILADIKALLEKYEARITTLETENKKLTDEIATLKKGTTMSDVKTPATTTVTSPTTSGTTAVNTGTAKYDKIVGIMNDILVNLLSENSIDPKATIGLFEFIEPNAFFISIDDGKNEAGITAFPYKFLYTYDKNYTLTKIGSFKLDQRTVLYVTLSGTNPYARATRIRVKNPLYKGKLLDEVVTAPNTDTNSTVTKPTSTTTPTPTNVTFEDIKKAYDRNDVINAVKLSDAYLANNAGTADIYRIRYRSFYIIGKYTDALTAVKKLEELNPSDFAKVIACDAVFIAKLAKQTTTQSYYQGLCKK